MSILYDFILLRNDLTLAEMLEIIFELNLNDPKVFADAIADSARIRKQKEELQFVVVDDSGKSRVVEVPPTDVIEDEESDVEVL